MGAFEPSGKNRFISVIPDDLYLFEGTDIIKAFEYMEKTFHLSPEWHKDFKEHLRKNSREISDQEVFFRYSREHIDPALQRILRRQESVIFSLCRWLIKDKIKQKRREDTNLKNFYRSDQWKKGK